MKTDDPGPQDVTAKQPKTDAAPPSPPPRAVPAPSARPMVLTTHRARILGPVAYRAGSGRKQNIPIGPCLVETLGGRSIDIIWGARGQSSVALPAEEIDAACEQGHLVLLD